MSLSLAFGARGVQKLVASLSEESAVADLAMNLTTLNGLLSSQENKMSALANDGAVLTPLTGLLAAGDAEVRRQAGLAVASLVLVYQGRLAAADAGTGAALGTEPPSKSPPVRPYSVSSIKVRDACPARLPSHPRAPLPSLRMCPCAAPTMPMLPSPASVFFTVSLSLFATCQSTSR